MHWLAFGCGAGLAPYAPGTVGTAIAVPLFLALSFLAWPIYFGVVAVLAALGVYLCDVTARDLGVHDHPGIVFDEVVGFLITMAFVLPSGHVNWITITLGFLLFRAFDIVKPWPIKWIDQKVTGGVGIMLDDVLAGIYAGVVLFALVLFAL